MGGSNGTPTYFLYDGTRVLCELDSGGNVTAAYGYGGTGLTQRFSVAGNTYTAYTFDPMGNVVSRMRQQDAAGHPYDLSDYDAFGQRLAYQVAGGQANSAVPPDAVGYGGQWGNVTDVEANLVLMGFRFYSPQYCRFLTRDPQGYEGGINLYAYCRNNPINRFDPLGLDGNGVDFLLGEAISYWNNNLDSTPVGQALHLIPGQGNLGHIKPANNDQADGEKFGTGLYIVGSIAAGGAKSVAGEAATGTSLLTRFLNAIRKTPCFVAGTSIAEGDGTFKAIEKIQAGDQVVSRDSETGKTEVKSVARTFQHTAYEIAVLELVDSSTGQIVERLQGTPTHPFFTPSGMIAMGDLKPGMQVSSRRGPPLVVKSVTVEKHPEGIAVYNFEVADDHTYFVGKAEGGAWVHNDCGLRSLGNGIWESPGGLRFGPGSAQGHRLAHVMEHLRANLARPVHSVFDVKSLIKILDEGWANRGTGILQSNGNRVYDVSMGRAIGTAGQTRLRIVVTDGTSDVITAFPVH